VISEFGDSFDMNCCCVINVIYVIWNTCDIDVNLYVLMIYVYICEYVNHV